MADDNNLSMLAGIIDSKTRFENAASRQYPGHVTLRTCRICGYIEWLCTTTAEPNGYTVVPFDRYPCPPCNEALMRHPELGRWVMNIIANLGADVLARLEEVKKPESTQR